MARRRPRRPGRRLLGLDLGERWVGVAATDDTGVLASPVATVDLRHQDIDAVLEFAKQHAVSGIVVGLPRTMSGSEGFQARQTREQAAEIQERTSIPVLYWDERLTTALAERITRGKRGKSRRKKAVPPDALAAAILLQSYVDANPVEPGHPGGW